ncbi:hypothetical protein HDV05_003534 [Chytridiales sp. JEL 0842]|nr:hypothetical protein HDV05_003534 [Chytridiales sp. JEL 0842]
MKRVATKHRPLVSDESTLYQALHPKPLEVVNPFNDLFYEQCVERFPDRFDFKWIVDLFTSWVNQKEMTATNLADRIKKPPLSTGGSVFTQFVHNKLLWRTDVSLNEFAIDSRRSVRLINIKFPNDGYLYKKNEEFNRIKDNIPMHKGETWCLVDPQDYKERLAVIVSYAQSVLQSLHETPLRMARFSTNSTTIST